MFRIRLLQWGQFCCTHSRTSSRSASGCGWFRAIYVEQPQYFLPSSLYLFPANFTTVEKNNILADPNNEFNPFAARQLINYLGQDRDLKEIANLDGIHKVAKAAQIVTPYSSMIVLVNDQQKNDLKQAEKESDRFKREIEDKQMPTFNNPIAVSAVPEPAEWMLIIVIAIALGIIVKRKKENAIV